MFTKKFLSDFSSNTLSVLFAKHKQVFLGRVLCASLAILFLYLWYQIRAFDVFFILFYVGLVGIAASMNKPFSFLHIASLPLFFMAYLVLPVLIDQTGLALVLTGLFVAAFFYYRNNKKLNALVQIALLVPTIIFITISLLS